MSTIGSKVFDYEVTRRIKAGGMGVVYEARRTWGKGEKVAIKFLLDQLRDDERIRQRFIREAEILEQLNHPWIVRILGLDPERDAFVMEFVEGVTLSEQLRRNPTAYRQPATAVGFLVKLLEAFDYAHKVPVEIKGKIENGIIHRDIKPSNIIVQPNGDPKVLDFGISRILTLESTLTDPKMQMGSVAYMSPEQVLNPVNVDWRSDIYSLGVNLWELFVGKSPYPQITTYEVVVQVQNQIRHESLPLLTETLADLLGEERLFLAKVDKIIAKATQKDPDLRYQNCREMRAALDALLEPDRPEEEIEEVPTLIVSEKAQKVQSESFSEPIKPVGSVGRIDNGLNRLPETKEPEKLAPLEEDDTKPEPSVEKKHPWLLYGGLLVLCLTGILVVWYLAQPSEPKAAVVAKADGVPVAVGAGLVTEGLDELEKVAKADSCHDIAEDYFQGRNGKEKDYAIAVQWYRKAADLGSSSAQAFLGYLYETGTGTPVNELEAVKWYQEAARKGNLDAQKNLQRLGKSW